MDINANDLNAPDEFDNPYDIDYELNQIENYDLEPNTDDNEKEKSDDEAIVIESNENEQETSKHILGFFNY